MTRNEELVDLLIQKGYHISFAESCTGGLAAAGIVDVPNASRVLDVSFITYADSAKVDILGVPEWIIRKHGVVSEEVAREMAAGVARRAGADIGVGITGIAGPTGATPEKPVGLVCFGISINGNVKTYKKEFGSIGRNEVRDASVKFCYDMLVELLTVND